jgi:hypothetical protein
MFQQYLTLALVVLIFRSGGVVVAGFMIEIDGVGGGGDGIHSGNGRR